MAREDKGMTLWQIDAGIEEALESLCDEDGVIDEEVEARLAELEMERPKKLENCALFVKNRRAMAAAIRAEEVALAERRHRYEADAERVERILARSLNGERFETPKVSIMWRRSQVVEIDEGAENTWDLYTAAACLIYSKKVDKQAVKEALRAGEEVPGARLVDKLNMRIEGVK